MLERRKGRVKMRGLLPMGYLAFALVAQLEAGWFGKARSGGRCCRAYHCAAAFQQQGVAPLPAELANAFAAAYLSEARRLVQAYAGCVFGKYTGL